MQGGHEEGPSELEIKQGLVSVAETLNFMHTSCALAHCNLSPESIIVAANGSWKVSGLHFATPISPTGAPWLPLQPHSCCTVPLRPRPQA